MEKSYKIVRFEEDYAVCCSSDEREVHIPFEIIPEDSVVGDTLVHKEGRYLKA
ncbi:MAG: hypothetical protein ACOXZ2_00305 [Sphaerochaetaceae bacterium]|jgi:hypothetical protein|nr:hypothetical protein [Sphaerochaetaceae bacterium]HHU88501.1 hypothetical protein [Spirochaetales bacterium]